MRVLILTVTAGGGHNSTAKALESEFLSRGAEVVLEDFYLQVSKLLFELVDRGYRFSVQHMRRPYKTAYNSLERHEHVRRTVAVLGGNWLFSRKYARKLRDLMPDVIISTHVFAAQMLNILKQRGLLDAPVIGVNTDYCIQPFWEEIGDIEYILTGSDLLNLSAIKKGIPERLLLPLGLPVRAQFQNTVPTEEAREKLGLDPKLHTVLIMGGSMGYGDMSSTVRSIDSIGEPMQIICICGTNERMKLNLEQVRTKSKLLVCGFVQEVELYMDASDVLVTKPGGLTVTEAMVKNLPMILIDPIPGHEERNSDFLVNNGVALRVSETTSVDEALYYLLKHPERFDMMRRSLELIAHPYATERVVDFALELAVRN